MTRDLHEEHEDFALKLLHSLVSRSPVSAMNDEVAVAINKSEIELLRDAYLRTRTGNLRMIRQESSSRWNRRLQREIAKQMSEDGDDDVSHVTFLAGESRSASPGTGPHTRDQPPDKAPPLVPSRSLDARAEEAVPAGASGGAGDRAGQRWQEGKGRHLKVPEQAVSLEVAEQQSQRFGAELFSLDFDVFQVRRLCVRASDAFGRVCRPLYLSVCVSDCCVRVDPGPESCSRSSRATRC